jgi:hypothetical protein
VEKQDLLQNWVEEGPDKILTKAAQLSKGISMHDYERDLLERLNAALDSAENVLPDSFLVVRFVSLTYLRQMDERTNKGRHQVDPTKHRMSSYNNPKTLVEAHISTAAAPSRPPIVEESLKRSVNLLNDQARKRQRLEVLLPSPTKNGRGNPATNSVTQKIGESIPRLVFILFLCLFPHLFYLSLS